jgi:chromosome partitioning protein
MPIFLVPSLEKVLQEDGSMASRESPRLGIPDLATSAARLAGRQPPTGRENLPGARRFPTWEVARYMLPVGAAHLRRVLKARPDLPQGEARGEGSTRWFALDEIAALRAHFGATPARPADGPRILATAHAATGMGKTVIAGHLALAAALEGWRILLVDLDPAAGLTRRFGAGCDGLWDTALPLIARHHAETLQAENRLRAGRGEAPAPLDETLARALRMAPSDPVRPAGWPGIDLVGAGLELARAEPMLSGWRTSLRRWRPWEALRSMLAKAGAGHDLVILDTGPGLGWLPVAALGAADILLVPMTAGNDGPGDTARFLGLLHDGLAAIEDGENATARALGLPEMAFGWQALRVVVSRYDPGRDARDAAEAEALLGSLAAPVRLAVSPMVAAGGPGLYAADYRDFGRETYVRAREPFDALWATVRDLALAPAA